MGFGSSDEGKGGYNNLAPHPSITVFGSQLSNFASQGGSVQKRIITFKMVELKTKTIINPNSCFSAILVSWFYVAGCMVLPELPYGSTLLTANLSLTSRPKLRMYATGLSFKITTKTHKQTHTHIMCVDAHVMLPPGSI